MIIVAGIAATIWWITRPSYDDMVKDCQKALNPSSTKTHRPAACKGLKQEDYDTLLMAWVVDHSLSKDDKDVSDYYDDGQVNGSVG
ncbi:hypothetical protein [Streptomyces sp. NPDC093060]|uniref:hypothetical protein n=1 Tax=Streptomyces sp. NPDC093060 TaxID=3366019 RepID=UPI00380029CA